MTTSFEGKSALVTGGGRGLGKAIALELARRGCHVTVFARTAEEVEETARDLNALGQGAGVVGDITEDDDVRRAVEQATVGDRLDILVNAAGGFMTSPSLDGDISGWREMFEKNLLGAYRACVEAGRVMKAQGSGRIVNFGSLLSFTAFPERAAYAASKAGVVQMTRVLGIEWAQYGIGVNAIVPGMIQIETPHPLMASGQMREASLIARIPAGRRGRPADVVGPVLFLASDDAAYVVGQTLVVDGGWLSYGYV